jgi:hypothetical protein
VKKDTLKLGGIGDISPIPAYLAQRETSATLEERTIKNERVSEMNTVILKISSKK